jgi:Flp pilus assembly CpaE family ATPase
MPNILKFTKTQFQQTGTVAADFESINKATEREKFLSDIAANQKIVKDIEHITLHITGEEKDKMKKGGIFSWLGSIFS